MVQATGETDEPTGDHPVSEKTLGQIAFASQFHPDEWSNITDWHKNAWETQASAVRDAVIEECAEYLRMVRWKMTREECLQPGVLAMERAVEEILSLKSMPDGHGDDGKSDLVAKVNRPAP